MSTSEIVAVVDDGDDIAHEKYDKAMRTPA